MKSKKILKSIVTFIILVITIGIGTNVFAAGNCSFIACGSFTSLPTLNVSSAVIQGAQYYSSMGYNSYRNTATVASSFNGTTAQGTKTLESDIVFLMGHGSYKELKVSEGAGISVPAKSGSIKTSDIIWKNTKLVALMGCETGKETTYTPVNIAYDIWAKSGYLNSSFGWRGTIYDGDMVKWANRFNSQLASGKSIYSAISYANGYNDYGYNSIKDLAFYGDSNLVLKKTRTASILEDFDNRTTGCTEDLEFNGEEDIDAVLNFMKNSYENFNKDDYEMSIFRLDNNKNYTIDLEYKIGEYYTNYGYVIQIKNGKLYQITNNMMETDVNKMEKLNIRENENYNMEDFKKRAKDELKESLSKKQQKELTIKSQNFKKFIDLQSKEKSMIISTIYQLNDEAKGGTISRYNI